MSLFYVIEVPFDQGQAQAARLPSGGNERRTLKRRSRSELETTTTLERAIAAPASKGLRYPSAARGRAATLYAKAQKRLPLMVLRVRRDRRMASAAERRSPETRVMSDASIAMSVPVPIARPRSAWARAGASLTPSPTIATTRPSS